MRTLMHTQHTHCPQLTCVMPLFSRLCLPYQPAMPRDCDPAGNSGLKCQPGESPPPSIFRHLWSLSWQHVHISWSRRAFLGGPAHHKGQVRKASTKQADVLPSPSDQDSVLWASQCPQRAQWDPVRQLTSSLRGVGTMILGAVVGQCEEAPGCPTLFPSK